MAVVLMSRGTMSGAALVVERLGERTGVRCVSREDLVTRVNRHGELARRIVDRLGNAARAYEDFCDLRRPYLIFMRAALLEYALEDDLVYHGFSGHLLLPPIPHFVTVRLQAPAELRIRMTMERRGCTEAEARRWIERDDEERVRWARFMYGKDIRDPGLYNVCVNLKRTGVDAACNIVEGLMADPEWRATPDSARMVERLWQATRIEAALLTDPRTDAIEAVARISDGRATVTGPYLDDTRRDAVVEIARDVSRMNDVTYECGFLPEFDVGS